MGRAKRAGEREVSFGRGKGRKGGCVEEGRRVWEGDNEGSAQRLSGERRGE